ncbi:MAG: hypothetical protein GXY32_08790 [Ruminococcaceae bacterium]|nr:hypothetical protein [Oscillospiraceae bacterium]
MDPYREYYQPSQLTRWRETDKPKMGDFNHDNQQLNDQALWKVVYDPRGFERDAFSAVYSETADSTALLRMVNVPDVATLAQLTNVPFYVRSASDSQAGAVTLAIRGKSGASLGSYALKFPQGDGTGLTSTAPAGWVRAGGVYTLALGSDGTLVVLNPQTQAATTAAPGTVQLNNTLASTSTGQALTAAQGKALEDKKIDRSQVVQETGASTTSLMSQKAVTDGLAEAIAATQLEPEGETPNLGLTQFAPNDKAAWATSYNTDMAKIDEAIAERPTGGDMVMADYDPTGAVANAGGIPAYTNVESGSNTNGRYTKYPDGTLVCTKIVTSPIAIAGAQGTLRR